MVTEFRALYADRFEERAFQLSLIGGLVHLGAHLGLKILSAHDRTKRSAAEAELSWWTRNVERALDARSPWRSETPADPPVEAP